MLPNLELWQYYTSEELAHGAPYDPEIIQMDNMHDEEMAAADGLRRSERKVVTLGWEEKFIFPRAPRIGFIFDDFYWQI